MRPKVQRRVVSWNWEVFAESFCAVSLKRLPTGEARNDLAQSPGANWRGRPPWSAHPPSNGLCHAPQGTKGRLRARLVASRASSRFAGLETGGWRKVMGVGSDRTIPVRLSTIPPSAWHADSAGKAARCSAQPVWPVAWLVVFHTQHGGRDAALRRPRAVQARNVRPSAWPPSQGQRTRFRRCTRRGRRSAPSLPELAGLARSKCEISG